MSFIIDIYAVMIVIAGLIIGSFLNVCIYRIPRGLSIVHPGSSCPSCNHKITPLENIPLLSFLWLRGKCRECKEKISWRYPLVEGLTAGLFLMTYLETGLGIELVLNAIFISSLIAIAFIDLDTMIIPNVLLLPGLISGITFLFINERVDHLIGLISLTILFLGIQFFGKIIFRKDAMGTGDVKLAGVLGFFLGWENGLVAVFLAFFIAAFFFMILSGSKKMTFGKAVPFGPFLSLGAIVSLFYGDFIIQMYLQLIVF